MACKYTYKGKEYSLSGLQALFAGGELDRIMGRKTGGEFGGLKLEDTSKIREQLGMEDYEGGYELSQEQAKVAAKKFIEKGGNIKPILDKVKANSNLTLTESAVVGEYLNSLAENYEKTKDEKIREEIKELVAMLDTYGTSTSESLQGRKLMLPKQDNLANFLNEMEAANGYELTKEQVVEETKAYEELKAAKEELQKQLDEEREKHARDIAELGYRKARAKANKEAKKTKEEYAADRKQILDGARDALKRLRGQSNISVNLGLNELRAITPFIKEAAKSYANQGIDKLDVLLTNLHADFKDLLDGLTKSHILSALGGEYDEKKPTKPRILNAMKTIEQEINLLKKINDARLGLDKVSPEKKGAANDRIKELQAKLKEVRRRRRLREIENDDAPIDKGLKKPLNMSEQEWDEKKAKLLEDKIKELADKIKYKDYEIEEPDKPKFKPSRKTLELQDKKVALEKEINRRKNQAIINRSKTASAVRIAKELLAVNRIAQTAIDWSVFFRQLAPVTMNLRYLKTSAKIFAAQKNATFSEKEFDRLMDDIKNSDNYYEAKEDGIVYNDINKFVEEEINEDYPKSFIYKVPVIGGAIKASNRAADAALNTARFQLYTMKARELERNGYTRETHPEVYKDMAQWVMNVTGRGKMLSWLEKGGAGKVFNSIFYGAKLMASRFNIIKPSTYIDFQALSPISEKKFKDYDPVKKEAIKDIVSMTVTVMATALAAAAAGAKVGLDKDEPDFLQVSWGDKKYDLTGGIAPYIRTVLRIGDAIVEQGMALAGLEDKKEAAATSEKAYNSTTRFFRNKLAPNPSYAINYFLGKNTIGEDFNPIDIARAYPMYFDDFLEAINEEGVSAFATVLAPNLIGIGQASYGNKGNIDYEERVQTPVVKKVKELFEKHDYKRKWYTQEEYYLNNKKKEFKEEELKKINDKVNAIAEKIVASNPDVVVDTYKDSNGETQEITKKLSSLKDNKDFSREVNKIYTKAKKRVIGEMFPGKIFSEEEKTEIEYRKAKSAEEEK